MYMAELHGKLSSRLEEGEDVLTSNVFSFFKYSNRAIFLRQYLAMLGFGVSLLDVQHAQFSFWPRFDENTEPDVIIRVGGHYALFEAKLRSGFGDGNATTKAQLIREIEGGMLEASNYGERFSLVAITADYCYKPHKFSCLRPEHATLFRWTSWQKITRLIQSVLDGGTPLTGSERAFAEDLYDLLCDKHLREYGGLRAISSARYQPKEFDTIFLDAATTSFRGDFIGFITSLAGEVGLMTQPASIFWHAKVIPHRGSNRRLYPERHSHPPRVRTAFFAGLGAEDALTPVEPFIFFRSGINGKQETDR
jgi:hypothetical protein